MLGTGLGEAPGVTLMRQRKPFISRRGINNSLTI
jgi:hypothetical protein